MVVFLLLATQTISAKEVANFTEKSEKNIHYSLGIGLSMITIDDYVGADESQFYLFPTPYFFYQSDSLVIDRNAFEGNVFTNKKWHLALDAAGSIPVDSDDNETRKGMKDLNWVGELGPSLEYYFSGNSRSNNSRYFDLAIRKAVNTNFKTIADTGWTGQLSLKNRSQFKAGLMGGSTTIDTSAAILFNSDKYARYFYSVSADDATEIRRAYNANGGYAGFRLSLGGTWRRNNIWFGIFTRYTYLKNTSFADSPLMRSHNNLLFGISVSYILIEK